MKFRWEKVGRSFVARFGNLTVTVDERGNATEGHRWLVRKVFGVQPYGDWHHEQHKALAEAEQIARREARYLARAFARGSR